MYTVCSLFAICSSAILGGFRASIPADRTRRRPSPAAVRNRVVRIRDCCALCVETARRIAHALRRGRLRTPPKVPCKERNKELAPFGKWCDPTVSAPGEAPCPGRASSTRHCPRPSGFARLVRSPCASGRSRLRTAKNTSSWPVRPAARKPRKAPSSPTSSTTYLRYAHRRT